VKPKSEDQNQHHDAERRRRGEQHHRRPRNQHGRGYNDAELPDSVAKFAGDDLDHPYDEQATVHEARESGREPLYSVVYSGRNDEDHPRRR
jgi:hypothetical protein